MKISQEQRRLLLKIVRQEFSKMCLANRAEKEMLKPKHPEKRQALLHRLAFWRSYTGLHQEQPALPVAKAASTGK
jgi:hypothetical protein